jgi:MoaA/NifB/PqqE/SkfB family radical SAM enzyme
MPFCYSPWTNLDISPIGDIAPCCKFLKQPDDPAFNIKTHNILEFKNSKFIKDLKQTFLSDQWPAGCERCRIEEQHGNIESKRQLDWQRWQQHYKTFDIEKDNFITASLAFGNTCNLKCITCGPHASSRWEKESKDLFGKTVKHFKFYKNNFVKDFLELAPNIIHLDIPGGEPFLSGVDEQKQLLEYYVNNNLAKDISLHYTTNVTQFPDQSWWDLWQHFHEIDMQLSIDGVDVRYEYIRYPADWQVTVLNTKKYLNKQQELSNFRLSVSHTISAYNIFYLDEFLDWCNDIGLPEPWMGRVHKPAHMRPEVWPAAPKSYIIDRLKNSKHLSGQTWANFLSNNDASDQFDTFKFWTQQHDQYRGQSFAQTFPEMYQWIK